ncbi:MAG: AraC family transcriptional regulator [Desulfobacterales bacterium]|nr:AraC family transcriptional regulator [Desulfobacterales bacterium]
MLSKDTIIDHRQRVQRVVIYINENLGAQLRLDHLSEVACFSPFHFLRVFESLMGETPQQYVIRKKMERAGFYLLKQKKSVTDIALGVAYETPSSFCKVFKKHFGISPRQFRDDITHEQYCRTNHPFRSITGNRSRSRFLPVPAIRKLEATKMICIKNKGVVNGNFLSSNLKAYENFRKKVNHHGLNGLMGNYISIYPTRPRKVKDSEATDYVGAILKKDTQLAENFQYFIFPPGKYAIFSHFGSYDFIMQTWNQAYMNWLPKSGVILRDLPPLEIHLDPSETDSELPLKSYLLIPIQ